MMRGGGLVQRQEAGGGSEGKSGGAVGDERQGQEHQPGLEPGALGGGGQVAGKGKGGGGVAAGDVRQCQWGEEGGRRGVHCQRRLFRSLAICNLLKPFFGGGRYLVSIVIEFSVSSQW